MYKQLHKEVGLDIDYNDVILNKTTTKELMRAFSTIPHERYSNDLEKWFVVWNDNTEGELSKILPLYSSGNPVYQIGNHAFKVFWDWSIMKWLVSA